MNSNDIPFVIAQILGFIIFILNIIGQSKLTARKVIRYNTFTSVLAVLEYGLLGAWSGLACCVVSIARNLAFNHYKNKVPLYILLLYIVAVIAINFPFIHNVVDVFPVFNIIIYAIALWTKNIMAIKIVGLCTAIPGTIYNLTYKAYVAILNEVVLCTVRFIAIYQIKKQKAAKNIKTPAKRKTTSKKKATKRKAA